MKCAFTFFFTLNMNHDLMKKIRRRTMTESLRVLEEVGSLRAIVTTLRMRMSAFISHTYFSLIYHTKRGYDGTTLPTSIVPVPRREIVFTYR